MYIKSTYDGLHVITGTTENVSYYCTVFKAAQPNQSRTCPQFGLIQLWLSIVVSSRPVQKDPCGRWGDSSQPSDCGELKIPVSMTTSTESVFCSQLHAVLRHSLSTLFVTMRHWCRQPGASCPVLLCRLIILIKSQVQILGQLLQDLCSVWCDRQLTLSRTCSSCQKNPLKEASRLKYVHVPLSEVMPLSHIRRIKWMHQDLWGVSTELFGLFWHLWFTLTFMCWSILLHFLRRVQTPGYEVDWCVSPALSPGVTNSADRTLPGSQLQPVITPTARPSLLWSLAIGEEQWEERRERRKEWWGKRKRK